MGRATRRRAPCWRLTPFCPMCSPRSPPRRYAAPTPRSLGFRISQDDDRLARHCDGRDDMITHRNTQVRLLAATVAAAALVLTAGCAPGTGTTPAKTAAPSRNVTTDAGKLGNVTLTVWD